MRLLRQNINSSKKQAVRVLFILALVACLPFQSLIAERFIPKSDLIKKVLGIINQLYVDNNRVIPDKMLQGSLEVLSTNIAPVMTKYKATKTKVIIDVRVDQFKRQFEVNKPKNLNEFNQILQQIVYFVKQHLEKGEKPEHIDAAVINGFLKQLDPHSFFLVPEIYSDFSTSTSGNFGGVGMMIGLKDGALTIVAPMDDTPASKAGLRAKDKIVQIDKESTINMSLNDAVKKLRGEKGTNVILHIMRKGFTTPKTYPITRDIIKIKSVESHVFQRKNKRVGYIKINTFQKNTLDEINSHLEDLDYDLNDFQGIIIDLRNNPGGLLDQAIKVSDRFLRKGVIVSTAGLTPNSIKSYRAHWFKSIVDIPIILLVNNGSASASEIVAAALKKNSRALVLGIQTFGKGSVQQVIEFKEGSALKITTSKYLTPGNISIQSVGVAPHIAVLPYIITNDYLHVTSPKLNRAEKSLSQNFSEWGDKAESAEKTLFYLFNKEETPTEPEEDLTQKEQKARQLNKDYLVKTAVKLLIQNQRNDFQNLKKSSYSFIEREKTIQEQNLVDRFSSFSIPIDWKKYPTKEPGNIESKIWLEIKNQSAEKESWKKHIGPIPADNDIRLYIEAKNIGEQRISRLLATSESKSNNFDDRQFAFGKLDPGESKRWYIPIKISESAPSRNNLIEFKFTDQMKQEIHADSFALIIQEKNRPEFHYEISFIDSGKFNSTGNGDGILQEQETIAMKVSITNTGKGDSGSLTLLLKNGEGKNVFLKKGRQTIKTLKVKKTEEVYFEFDLKKTPVDEDLDFSLSILDGTYSLSSINQKLKIPLFKQAPELVNMAPSIQIESPKLLSVKNSYHFKAEILDTKGVKDVYIFQNDKKIFYKNFVEQNERNKVHFNLDIDLEDENNRIAVFTRDDDNVTTRKNLYLRYLKSK